MFLGTTLGSLDILLFAVSLGVTVLIGLYFANKNKTFADYATGGGNQNLWAVSASMAAGYCSGLTLIGNPSELYMHGTSFSLKMATTILAWPVSSFVFLPVFRRLDGISIFQYIENRFHPLLRRFVSLLFIFQMTFYSAITLYLPSLPLFAALGIPQSISIGLVGCICIIYCTFGGIKAVTWTNLYHSILLIVAMLLIIIVGTHQAGGLGNVLKQSFEGGRLSLGPNYLQLDLTTRHTIFNTVFGYTLIRLFLHGTSQMQVQSALSLSTIRKAQLAQLISALLYLLIQVIASAIGLLLYISYKDCDPYMSGQIKRQDELMIHYVSQNLGSIPGLQGAFIAAIFGSTLTSMSSFQSSTSAMVVEDFIRPLYGCFKLGPLNDRLAASLGKMMAFTLGLICILLTFEMERISGLQQATTTLYGVIGMPILATFLLGACTRFINTPGMFAGMLAAISFGLFVFGEQVLRGVPLEPSLATSTSGCQLSDEVFRVIVSQTGPSMSQPQVGPELSGIAPNGSAYLLTAGNQGPAGQQLGLSDLVAFAGSFLSSPELLGPSALPDESHPVGANSTGAASTSGESTMSLSHQLVAGGDLEQPMQRVPMDLGAGLAQMSYLWLPLFTLSIATIVATLVSLLTGGARQKVDGKYLAPFFKFQASDSDQAKQLQAGQWLENCERHSMEFRLDKPVLEKKFEPPEFEQKQQPQMQQFQCCRCLQLQQAIAAVATNNHTLTDGPIEPERPALGVSLIGVNSTTRPELSTV